MFFVVTFCCNKCGQGWILWHIKQQQSLDLTRTRDRPDMAGLVALVASAFSVFGTLFHNKQGLCGCCYCEHHHSREVFGFGILASGTRDGRSIGWCVAATWKRRFSHTFPTEASKGPQPGAHGPDDLICC